MIVALILFANRQPPTANRQPPTANRQPPTANRQPPTANRHLPTATCHLPPGLRPDGFFTAVMVLATLFYAGVGAVQLLGQGGD